MFMRITRKLGDFLIDCKKAVNFRMKKKEYKHIMAKLTNSVAVCFIGSEDAVTNSITYPVTRDARSIRTLELICCALWSNSKVGADSWICRVWISTAVKGS